MSNFSVIGDDMLSNLNPHIARPQSKTLGEYIIDDLENIVIKDRFDKPHINDLVHQLIC
jgi:hypothetical protein